MFRKFRLILFVLLILLIWSISRIYSSKTFVLPWQKDVGEVVTPTPISTPTATDSGSSLPSTDPDLAKISLPPGFSIEYFAKDVPGARSMTLGKDGVVYVGNRDKDKVYALVDANRDMVAEKIVVVDENLKTPNGVAYKDGDLYVGLVDRILKYPSIDTTYDASPTPEIIFSDFPTDTHHGWKYIAFGPDGMLYVPVGAPCNICDREDPYASITRIDVNNPQNGYEVIARGIRNTVGFDWEPTTGKLWFTDNGRDLLGDNLPPDELNRADAVDDHFGYPYCHAGTIIDPQFGNGKKCTDYTAPQESLSPHTAALGMKFYDGTAFPSEYTNTVFIAEHGSWNRSEKIGYRVTQVSIDSRGEATDYRVFAQGWLQGEQVWGRPVDVLVYTDGSLLISDDYKGAVYRIFYRQ